MRRKYRDNMTDEEMKQFMAEIEAEDNAYAEAAAFDAANYVPPPEDWEDEMGTLRDAALDHRGLP